jgi:hypothetical protein
MDGAGRGLAPIPGGKGNPGLRQSHPGVVL